MVAKERSRAKLIYLYLGIGEILEPNDYLDTVKFFKKQIK